MKKKQRRENRNKPTAKGPVRQSVSVANQMKIEPGFWKKNLLMAVVIFVFPFLLYFATRTYDFVLDDVLVLSENNFVKEGFSGLGDIFGNEGFTGYLGQQKDLVAGGRYRPLSLAVFAVAYEFVGLDPGFYHILNIFFYALLGLLVFRLTALLFLESKSRYYNIPVAASLLFLAHPVHTEAVANIKGLDEVLTTLLSVATLIVSLLYIGKRKVIYLVISGILFLLALLAKENALTFFAVIPVTVYLFTQASLKENLKTLVPLSAALVVYFMIRYSALGFFFSSGAEITGLMNNPFVEMNGAEKYATIFFTLWKYVQLLFFPHPLTHDYYPYQIPIMQWSDPGAFLSLLFYLFIGGYALYHIRKKGHVPAYSIFFFIATLSLTSNIVFPIGTFMNERFLFMPSIGFCLLAGWWLVNWLPEKLKKGNAGLYAGMALLFVTLTGYSYKTVTRVPAWKDSYSLNAAAIKVSVNSARLNNFMGYEFYVMATTEQDRQKKRELLDTASYYVERSLSIYPSYSEALNCSAGIAAGYFQLDNDMDKLLSEFYQILSIRHMPYIDTYMEYLNRRGLNSKVQDFYYRAGYELFARKKMDYANALKYLNYGLQMDAGDQRLLNARAEVMKVKR